MAGLGGETHGTLAIGYVDSFVEAGVPSRDVLRATTTLAPFVKHYRKYERSTAMQNVYDAITAAIQTFSGAFERGDAAAVAAWYTPDATLLPPDNPMMKGRDAIQAFWQGAMGTGVREAKLETLEVETRGDLAYEVGRFEMVVRPQDGEQTEMTGKYVVVWKLEGDGWRMHVDIWNGDRSK